MPFSHELKWTSLQETSAYQRARYCRCIPRIDRLQDMVSWSSPFWQAGSAQPLDPEDYQILPQAVLGTHGRALPSLPQNVMNDAELDFC